MPKSVKVKTLFGTIVIDGGQMISSSIERYHGLNEASIDAVESLVLAHHMAGVDVTADEYIDGINTTLEAIDNNS